jgi:hypothetical protein
MEPRIWFQSSLSKKKIQVPKIRPDSNLVFIYLFIYLFLFFKKIHKKNFILVLWKKKKKINISNFLQIISIVWKLPRYLGTHYGWVGSCQLPKLPCCFPFTVLMEGLVLDVMVMSYAPRVEFVICFWLITWASSCKMWFASVDSPNMWVVHVMHNGYGNFFCWDLVWILQVCLADFFCSQVLALLFLSWMH